MHSSVSLPRTKTHANITFLLLPCSKISSSIPAHPSTPLLRRRCSKRAASHAQRDQCLEQSPFQALLALELADSLGRLMGWPDAHQDGGRKQAVCREAGGTVQHLKNSFGGGMRRLSATLSQNSSSCANAARRKLSMQMLALSFV